MNYFEKQTLQNIVITSPCAVSWDTMEGSDTVRFCERCSLNVHNLSNMSQTEAVSHLADLKPGRNCVFLVRKDDGSVATDNCPVVFKAVRDRLRARTLSWLMVLSIALAQGTLAYASDPRYCPSNEIGLLADYGYDQARDLANIVTTITSLLALLLIIDRRRKVELERFILESLAITLIPVVVCLASQFCINNFGGMGGGGI